MWTKRDDGEIKEHLWLLLTGAILSGDGEPRVACASISSVRSNAPLAVDRTCILQPGDHPFIQHESFVWYARTELHSVANLQQRLDAGTSPIQEWCIKPHEAFEPAVLDRIVAGVSTSIHTPEKVLLFVAPPA